MRIVHIQSHILKLASSESYLGATETGPPPRGYAVRTPWRSLYSDLYETVLVEVRTECGTVGWGEALAPVGPEVVASIIDSLLAPYVIDREFTGPRALWFDLRDLMRERGHLGGHQADALAALDIALWDLWGKLHHQPSGALAGGCLRDRIPLYVSGLPSPDPGRRVEMAHELHEKGARRLKLHLGHGIRKDLETLDPILGLGLDLQIAVDAHWAYSVTDALTLTRELAHRRAWFLEAPLAPEDIAGHRDLLSRSEVPVAVGETIRHRYEAEQWLDAHALSILQPDVARTGITEALSMAELAESRHVVLAPHHSVCTGVAFAAGVLVSALTPQLLAFEYQPYPLSATAEVASIALDDTLSHAPVPTTPGIGAVVNDEFIKERCVKC